MVEPGLKLFVDESSNRGRQYPTDVGTIDLLFVRPNGDMVVIELKRFRGSDEVVGQISRYIGWIKHHVAYYKNVYGVIITHQYDSKLKYAVEGNEKLTLKYYRIHIEFVDEAQVKSQQ